MQAAGSSFADLISQLCSDRHGPRGYVTEVNPENLNSFVESAGTVVLGFHNYWCNPSKTLLSYLKKVAEKYDGKFAVGAVWFEDEGKKFARHYGLDAIPAVLVFLNGYKAGEIIGIGSEEDFFQGFEKILEKP